MSRPKPPAYQPPPSPGESMMDFAFGDAEWAQGMGVLSPEVQEAMLSAESQYGPQWQELDLALQNDALFSDDGLISQAQRAAPAFADIETDIFSRRRAGDIADLEQYGGRAVAAARESDPERLRLIQQQQGLVDDLFARAQGVTPQQGRMAQQSAREAFGARGREMDNSAIFSEGLGREEIMRQNRAEAMMGAGQLFPQYQQSGADIGMAVLGRTSGALPFANASGQQAMGMGQSLGPNLFNPDAAINLAQQQNANQNNFNQTAYGSQMAYGGAMGGGLMDGIGSALSGAFGAFGKK